MPAAPAHGDVVACRRNPHEQTLVPAGVSAAPNAHRLVFPTAHQHFIYLDVNVRCLAACLYLIYFLFGNHSADFDEMRHTTHHYPPPSSHPPAPFNHYVEGKQGQRDGEFVRTPPWRVFAARVVGEWWASGGSLVRPCSHAAER